MKIKEVIENLRLGKAARHPVWTRDFFWSWNDFITKLARSDLYEMYFKNENDDGWEIKPEKNNEH